MIGKALGVGWGGGDHAPCRSTLWAQSGCSSIINFVSSKTKSGIKLGEDNIHADSSWGQAKGRREAPTPRASHQLRH